MCVKEIPFSFPTLAMIMQTSIDRNAYVFYFLNFAAVLLPFPYFNYVFMVTTLLSKLGAYLFPFHSFAAQKLTL